MKQKYQFSFILTFSISKRVSAIKILPVNASQLIPVKTTFMMKKVKVFKRGPNMAIQWGNH
jgi:hypothetical protein